jgi:hypothetical protein
MKKLGQKPSRTWQRTILVAEMIIRIHKDFSFLLGDECGDHCQTNCHQHRAVEVYRTREARSDG